MPRRLRLRHGTILPTLLEQIEPRCLLSLLITGTPGDDRIIVAFSADYGDVTIRQAPGYAGGTVLHNISGVVLDGGDGNDYLEVEVLGLYPYGRPDSPMYATLRGGSGDDTLLGGDDYTRFEGGPGNDKLTGRAVDGQQNRSGIDFSSLAGPVVVRLDLGTIPQDGHGGHDTVKGIGEIIGTAANDVIYAGPRNGWYYGGKGDDLMVANNITGSNLVGEDGNDTLVGGNGPDQLDPGAGEDEVSGGADSDNLIYYASEGSTHGALIRLDRQIVEDDGSGSVDHISGIENVYVYSPYPDTIYGNGQHNVLHADDGADFIAGGGGNDSLQGGQCSTLLGGSGDDYLPSDYRFTFIDGGLGADRIDLWGFSDSQDQIVSDSDDTISDYRGPDPTPPDLIKADCEAMPYESPPEQMAAGSDEPVVAPPQQHKKPRAHHKHERHHQHPKTAAALPFYSPMARRS